MADDGEDVGGWNYLTGGGNDVAEEGLAADLVQDFGTAGFEAGAFAGGHDDYGQF